MKDERGTGGRETKQKRKIVKQKERGRKEPGRKTEETREKGRRETRGRGRRGRNREKIEGKSEEEIGEAKGETYEKSDMWMEEESEGSQSSKDKQKKRKRAEKGKMRHKKFSGILAGAFLCLSYFSSASLVCIATVESGFNIIARPLVNFDFCVVWEKEHINALLGSEKPPQVLAL